MSLTKSIVEDAAKACGFSNLTFSQGENEEDGKVVKSRVDRTLTRPLPLGEEKREAIRWLNLAIPEEAREEALRKVLRVETPSLTQTNRAFHRKLMKSVLIWCVFSIRITNSF